jgi:hypothetical protein
MWVFEHALISVCRVGFEIGPGFVEFAVRASIQLVVKGDRCRNSLHQLFPLVCGPAKALLPSTPASEKTISASRAALTLSSNSAGN